MNWRNPIFKLLLELCSTLKGNHGKGILFKRNGRLNIEAYTDVDYAGSLVHKRLTNGYCTFLVGNLVTWRSKRTKCGCKINLEGFMKLSCHNKSKIDIAHNLIQKDKIKHIEIDRHFIKGKLHKGLV